MDLAVILALLAALFDVIAGLRCYAGHPGRRQECNSLSYCVVITARNGRSQWSCDGHTLSQVSLCASLDMDAPRHRIYEAAPPTKAPSFYPFGDSSDTSATGSRRRYGNRGQGNYVPDPEFDYPLGSKPDSGGKRCFNAGALGRICCCAEDFCNGSSGVFSGVFGWGLTFSVFAPVILAWFR